MIEKKAILIEGYTLDEIFAVIDKESEHLVFSGQPVIFRAGSADVLAEFSLKENKMIIELAQIDRGGEGVLPALATLARR